MSEVNVTYNEGLYFSTNEPQGIVPNLVESVGLEVAILNPRGGHIDSVVEVGVEYELGTKSIIYALPLSIAVALDISETTPIGSYPHESDLGLATTYIVALAITRTVAKALGLTDYYIGYVTESTTLYAPIGKRNQTYD